MKLVVKLIDKNHVLTSVADFSEANTASTASASGKTNTKQQDTTHIRGSEPSTDAS